jgi:hypothetical protein
LYDTSTRGGGGGRVPLLLHHFSANQISKRR